LPEFAEHIEQACRNLKFLHSVNGTVSDSWDWQVTIAFYVSVHLIGAHIAKVGNLHFRSHTDVQHAINPFNSIPIAKTDEQVYVAYDKLHRLSRRSRYLVHDDLKNKTENAQFTHTVHFRKAMIHLDTIIGYFITLYKITIPEIEIKCIDLKPNELNHISVIA
jgi:hypothetical protein